MLIRSIIERDEGSTIELDGRSYKFQPFPPKITSHVCEITDRDHCRRLLSITEGFELYFEGDDDERPAPNLPATSSVPLVQDDGDDADDNMSAIEATTTASPDAQANQPLAKSLEADASPADEPTQNQVVEDNGDGLQPLTRASLEHMGEEELRVTYAKLNDGRQAPANAKPETLRTRISEMLDQ